MLKLSIIVNLLKKIILCPKIPVLCKLRKGIAQKRGKLIVLHAQKFGKTKCAQKLRKFCEKKKYCHFVETVLSEVLFRFSPYNLYTVELAQKSALYFKKPEYGMIKLSSLYFLFTIFNFQYIGIFIF